MISHVLTILAVLLVLVALVWLFVKGRASVLPAYAGMLCAFFGSGGSGDVDLLIFWGVATALVLGAGSLQSPDAELKPTGARYVAVGSLAGAAVGCACVPSSGAIILGSITGAVLAAVAYMRTPGSPHLAPGSAPFVRFLAAAGLPAVITCSMAAIVAAAFL